MQFPVIFFVLFIVGTKNLFLLNHYFLTFPMF